MIHLSGQKINETNKTTAMDGFTYHNIFETKGIEYLAIILFFMVLIPFWLILNKKTGINQKLKNSLGLLTSGIIRIPQGVFFSNNHTWAFLEKRGTAKVGIDDLISHITGDLRLENLPEAGRRIQKGEELVTLSSNGKRLKVYSPISGTISQSNHDLLQNPDDISYDPYNSGWICRIKPFNWIEETNSYYLAENANEWTANELERFRDFLSDAIIKYSTDPEKIILQSGGELRDQPLADLPEGVWNDFQKAFMDAK